jgi:hypothetical protein
VHACLPGLFSREHARESVQALIGERVCEGAVGREREREREREGEREREQLRKSVQAFVRERVRSCVQAFVRVCTERGEKGRGIGLERERQGEGGRVDGREEWREDGCKEAGR